MTDINSQRLNKMWGLDFQPEVVADNELPHAKLCENAGWNLGERFGSNQPGCEVFLGAPSFSFRGFGVQVSVLSTVTIEPTHLSLTGEETTDSQDIPLKSWPQFACRKESCAPRKRCNFWCKSRHLQRVRVPQDPVRRYICGNKKDNSRRWFKTRVLCRRVPLKNVKCTRGQWRLK